MRHTREMTESSIVHRWQPSGKRWRKTIRDRWWWWWWTNELQSGI